MQILDSFIAQLRETDDDDVRDEIKSKMVSVAEQGSKSEVREYLERAMKEELLEVQWELEEVIDALTPAKKTAPEPEPEPEETPASRPLRPEDLELVYNDPRGLQLYKSKFDDRWVARQLDQTGQPVMFPLDGLEVEHLKGQLARSPYWLKQV